MKNIFLIVAFLSVGIFSQLVSAQVFDYETWEPDTATNTETLTWYYIQGTDDTASYQEVVYATWMLDIDKISGTNSATVYIDVAGDNVGGSLSTWVPANYFSVGDVSLDTLITITLYGTSTRLRYAASGTMSIEVTPVLVIKEVP